MALKDMISGLLQDEGKGWKMDLFIDSNVRKEYGCCVCNNICKNAVELSCDVDHDDDSIQIYCQQCLQSVISCNNGQCPVDNHSKPTYSPNRRIRGKINKARVLCPNSMRYQQHKVKLDKDNDDGNVFVDTADEKEGIIANNDLNRDESKGCKFEGCLSELIAHILKCCESNLDSKKVQYEMIKLLRKDIDKMKKTVAVQAAKIDELTKQNINITQKYEQQNEKIKQLENMINSIITQETEQKEQKEQNEVKEEKKEEGIDRKSEYKAWFRGSTIIRNDEYETLLGFFDNKGKGIKQMERIYRGSDDDFNAITFHQKCDDVGPTLIIIQSQHTHVFGGFTMKSWKDETSQKSGQWKEDKDAFIYILRSPNDNVLPERWKVLPDKKQKTIRCDRGYGPVFGYGFDIAICSECDKKKDSSSQLDTERACFGAPKEDDYLAGEYYFLVNDYEVYKVIM